MYNMHQSSRLLKFINGFATANYTNIEPDFKGRIKYGIRGQYLKAGQTVPAADERYCCMGMGGLAVQWIILKQVNKSMQNVLPEDSFYSIPAKVFVTNL